MMVDRKALLQQVAPALDEILTTLAQQPHLDLAQLPLDRAVLVSVDMNEGFTRKGPLSSPRINALSPEVARVHRRCRDLGIPMLVFTDSHDQNSPEFIENGGSYPTHCLAGTEESEPIPEIQEIGGYTLIPKNSTNGYLEPAFQAWRRQNPDRTVFVVIGDCTDICVSHFATTLKADANRQNQTVRVIVIGSAVQTYDAPWHPGDLLHVMALFMMHGNGIEIAPQVS